MLKKKQSYSYMKNMRFLCSTLYNDTVCSRYDILHNVQM